MVTQNYRNDSVENDVTFRNDKIVEGSSASPMTLSEINRKSLSSTSLSDGGSMAMKKGNVK